MMRVRAWPLLVACLIRPAPVGAEANDPPTLDVIRRDFASANELMLKGETKSAAALYESLVEGGAKHPNIYFNLGTAYAQDQQWVKAVIAYERALRLEPNAKDVKANLRAARMALTGQDHAAQTPEGHGLADLVEPWVAPVPPPVAATIVIGTQAALVLALLLFGSGRRVLGGALGTCALAATLVAGAITAGHYVVHSDPRAVVVEPVTLRKGPDRRFEPTTEVPAGSRVRILTTEGAWHEVQRSDGTVGWMRGRSLERV